MITNDRELATLEKAVSYIATLEAENERLKESDARHKNTYVTKAWESLEAERDADEVLLRSCYEILGSGYGNLSEKLEERLGL
jgi:hypothetical protein